MQPTPLVTITGTVLNVRPVVIEPRAATETSKAYEGGSYVEVTLGTKDCALAGEAVPGLLAYTTVRFDTDDAHLEQLVPGSEIAALCSSFVDLYKIRGRWANSVGFRFSRLVRPITQPARSAA